MTIAPGGDARTESAPVVLRAEGLCFATPQRPLFTGWSARIGPGVTLLRGGDGVGKTTLLRFLAGALPATAGELRVGDIDLASQAAAYRQQVFWADPRSAAHDQISASHWFAAQSGQYPDLDRRVLADLVDGFGLGPHLEKPLYMLSTGSKRKVWLAAAFASGAAVTLLDEPFAALDKASIELVLGLLQEASGHPSRAWVVAGYEAPAGVPLAALIDLGD